MSSHLPNSSSDRPTGWDGLWSLQGYEEYLPDLWLL